MSGIVALMECSPPGIMVNTGTKELAHARATRERDALNLATEVVKNLGRLTRLHVEQQLGPHGVGAGVRNVGDVERASGEELECEHIYNI